MYPAKQSTALTIPVFAHDANGDAVTGLVDGNFTKRISKNGGAFGAMTVTITEMENGWYSLPIGTGHSDTLGVLSITLTSSAKQINVQLRVHARLPDDLAYPATTGRSLDVDASGRIVIQGTLNDLDSLENIAITDIVSDGTALQTTAGALDVCTLVTDVAGFTSAGQAEIQAECNDAIVANGLDHLVGTAVADTDVTDNSIIAKLADSGATADFTNYVWTTDSLRAIRDQGDSAWLTATGFSTHAATDIVSAGAITTSGGAVSNVTLVATTTTNTDMLTATDVLTTQMTESYAANGVAPTLAQAQFAIHQMLMQFGIVGTALTVRQLDDSTTAFIVTLDSASAPTDASRV